MGFTARHVRPGCAVRSERRAKTYYAKLMALCRQADSVRPEIEEAKAFLAGVNVKDLGVNAKGSGMFDRNR